MPAELCADPRSLSRYCPDMAKIRVQISHVRTSNGIKDRLIFAYVSSAVQSTHREESAQISSPARLSIPFRRFRSEVPIKPAKIRSISFSSGNVMRKS